MNLLDDAEVFVKEGTLSDTINYEGGVDVTYTGTTAKTTGKELPIDVNQLTIDKPANVTLDKSVTVKDSLAFNSGHLITGDYMLILDSAAVITKGDVGDVWGSLQFPPFLVGTDSLSIAGVFIGSGIDDIGSVRVIIISGPGSAVVVDSSESINRRWIITSDYPPTNGRQLILSWTPEEDNDVDLTQVQAWKSTDNGATWRVSGSVQDASQTRSVDLDIVSFSQWTVANLDNTYIEKVNILEIQRLIAKLNSADGDGVYHPNYDEDNDGDIDIIDLKLMMSRWGNQ